MAGFNRIFVVGNAPRILALYDKKIAQAEAAGLVGLADALSVQLSVLLEELTTLELATAKLADKAMKGRLDATAKRGPTGNAPHLRGALRSRPVRFAGLPLGVGVASIDALDKVTNPLTGYGPYWRAQEYGTGSKEVPSQKDRLIYGLFVGKVSPEPPRAIYAGGGGPHTAFVPTRAGQNAAALRGGKGGPGQIHHEIRARHFIRDGADAALVEFAAGLRIIEGQQVRRLATLAAAPGAAGTRKKRVARARPRPGRR